jgi:hypothetical protein
MKRLILCLLFPFCAFSQDIFFDQPYFILKEIEGSFSGMSFVRNTSYFFNDWEQQKSIKNAHVKEMKIKRIDKKGKIRESIQNFNQAGKFVYGYAESNKVEEKKTYLYDTLPIYRTIKTKRKFYEFKTSYADGKKINQQKLKNGKLIYNLQLEYTSFGKSSKTSVSKKRKVYEMNYQYNKDNQLERTTYLINGKVKRIWNHSCKPEGEALKNPKLEVLSSVCQFREENNDGSYAVFERTIRNKKAFLKKTCYSKDSVFLAEYLFDRDSILYRSVVNENNCTLTSNYTQKQKVQTQNKTCFSNKYPVEYQWIKKGKIKYRTTWERNEIGFATTMKRYKKNETNPYWINSNLTNDRNLVYESSYQRKGKQLHKVITEYTYY